jgi:hypothetical protein
MLQRRSDGVARLPAFRRARLALPYSVAFVTGSPKCGLARCRFMASIDPSSSFKA